MNDAFYSFAVTTLQGEEISLEEFRGKVILVVNTASQCGFTPQLKGLQELYEQLESRGFVVLGFPCDQFGGQELGSAEEIEQFCTMRYQVTFPMFEKVDVNGENGHSLFQYLKKQLGGLLGSNIKWNFTKFLIDQNGFPIKRYAPLTKPSKIKPDIIKALETIEQ